MALKTGAMVIFAVLGAGAGLWVASHWMLRYTASATLSIEHSEDFAAIRAETLSASSLSSVIQSPRVNLYAKEREHGSLEEAIEMLRRDTDIRLSESGSRFTIRVTCRDPKQAQRATQEMVRQLMESRTHRMRARESAAIASSRQAILDRLDWLEARGAALESRMGIHRKPSTIAPETDVEVIDGPAMPVHPDYTGWAWPPR